MKCTALNSLTSVLIKLSMERHVQVMKRPVAIDLFSGCGGLTLGLKQAGFRVVGAVEKDELSVKTYKINHRRIVIWNDDIRNVSTHKMKRRLKLRKGELDLLAGCPPCQGFSTIRTRNGAEVVKDSRNDLVFEFLRFVRDLKPKAIMMENVPGLATDRRMRRLKKELDKLGYEYKCEILDAADFGVPQRRRRMILLGSRFGSVGFAQSDLERRTVRETISMLPPAGLSGDPLHDFPSAHSKETLEFFKRIPKNGGSRRDLGKRYQLKCHRGFDGFEDVYGRMKWDDVAPTITGGCLSPSKGRFLHPKYNRAITLREAALLQSFPRDYKISLDQGKHKAAALIGNALPPEFIKRIAAGINQFLQSRKGRHAFNTSTSRQKTAS